MAREVYPENNTISLSEAQARAYERLLLSEGAGLSDVVKAIDLREGARRFLHAVSPNEQRDAEALYEVSLTRGIQAELIRCLATPGGDQIEALRGLTESLQAVRQLPISETSLKRLDEAFLDIALDVLADTASTPLEKAASVTLSLHFGLEQRGVAKTQMILEQRVVAEQAMSVSHINKQARENNRTRLSALDDYLKMAGLKFEAQAVDSTMTAGVQKATQIAKNNLEKGRLVAGEGKRAGFRVASVAVIASMGVAGASSMAAAGEEMVATQAEALAGGAGASVEQTLPTDGLRQTKGVAMTGKVEVVTEAPKSPRIEGGKVAKVAMTGAVEKVDVSTIPVNTVELKTSPAVVTKVATEGKVETNSEIPPVVDTKAIPLAPGDKQPTPKPEVQIEPEVEENPLEDWEKEDEPIKVEAPDNDVNIGEDETPQEALARIVASRDMTAASYAIRKMYGGNNVSEQPPVNATLSNLITSDVATLKAQISEVAHSKPAYTEKAFYALAYLDAVTQAPSLLDNPEVVAFVESVSNQGEEYRNKLFATYLAEAHAVLEAEKAGSYNGIAEPYRESIEKLYAYAALAGVSDEKQAEQIDAIKVEEARLAEEARKKAEEERRKAEEEERRRIRDESGVEMPEAPTKATISALTFEKMIAMGDKWTNRGIVLKYLVEHGFTPEQASGIIGNFIIESGVDPEKEQYGGGPGRGLAQWGSTDPRFDRFGYDGKRGLVLFATQQGKSWEDMYVQLDFMMHEFNTTESRAYIAVKATQTAREATFEFEDKYERAGVTAIEKRYAATEDVYTQYQQLRTAAETELNAIYEAQKKAAEDEIARKKAEAEEEERRQREAEERRQREAQAEGDMRSELADGVAVRAQLKEKYGNVSGRLSDSELTSLQSYYADGNPMTIRLQHDAAEGFQYLAAAFKARFGVDLRVTDHYRDYDAQVRTKIAKGRFAARPGTSNHGWGMALDLASSISTEGSEQHEWMEQNAHKYGWINPEWAHDGVAEGGAEEPWHWEFMGNKATYEISN